MKEFKNYGQSGAEYVRSFYNLVLENEVWFDFTSNGSSFTGITHLDIENIDTSKFSNFAAKRSDKPIKATYAERVLRTLRAADRSNFKALGLIL